jgi:hypothetical protein
VADEAELLRHDISVLERLLAASRDRARETGDPDGHESVVSQACAEVLGERLERLGQLEQERPP